MTGQKKTAAIEHFDGCMQWDITKFVSEYINETHNVIQKGIYTNEKIVTTIMHTRFGRQLLNYVTKHK